MFHLLDRISCPEDVKKLNIEETHVLAEEIRAFLIDSVSKPDPATHELYEKLFLKYKAVHDALAPIYRG